MKRLKTGIVSMAALAGAMSASAGLELVTNGGFENGNVENYSISSGGRRWCTPVGGWAYCAMQRGRSNWCWLTDPHGGEYITYFQGATGASISLDFPAAGTYRLSFWYKGRDDGTAYTPHYRAVKLGDTQLLTYTATYNNGAWSQIVKDFYVSMPGPQKLNFCLDPTKTGSSDPCSAIDDVSVTLLYPGAKVLKSDFVTNGGFESDSCDTYTYLSPSGWTECGGVGISRSGYWCSNVRAGTYSCFIQAGGLSQVLDLPEAGTYQLAYSSSRRSGNSTAITINAAIDGQRFDYRTIAAGSGDDWAQRGPYFTVAEPGQHKLRFYISGYTGDQSAMLDAVSVKFYKAAVVTDCADWRTLKAVLETGGDARLVKDVVMDSSGEVVLNGAQNVTLDLNGHKITSTTTGRVFQLTDGCWVKLTVTDSVGGGAIDGQNVERTSVSGGCVYVGGYGEFVLEGGTIRNFKTTVYDGGAIYTRRLTTINGGTISNCVAVSHQGGGIMVAAGTLNMNDGAIVNCGGASNGNGGGIYNNGGTVNMNGGLIAGCAANDRGGAIHNQSGATHIHGVISNCTARCAGGVSGSGGTVYLYDDGAIVTNYCSHATQTAFDGPGALFDGGHFVMYGGRICDNYGASARGFTGLVMWSAGNTFTMYGGVISNNTTASAGVTVKQIGVYSGTVSLQGGIVEQEPTAANIQGYNGSVSVASYAKVGDWYVLGSSIATDTDKTALTGGTLKFNPTNELYAAAGLKVAAGSVATGSGQSWTVAATNAVEVGDWTSLNANLAAGNDVKLTGDVTQDKSLGDASCPVRAAVTLDLNGHTLYQVGGQHLFGVSGSAAKLTLTDSSDEGTGAIVGDFTEAYAHGRAVNVDGGGEFVLEKGAIRNFNAYYNQDGNTGISVILLQNNCKMTMNGGTIEGCKGNQGGAIYMKQGATFTMNGGTITNCVSTTAGGAVYNTQGAVTMTGGKIVGNTSTTWGGGVFVTGSGTMSFTGGEISYNTANGSIGGGGICSSGKVTMTGGSLIGNTSTGNANSTAFYSNGDDSDLIYGGVIEGTICREQTPDLYIHGGVYDRSQASLCASGKSCVQVGSKWVVGATVAYDANTNLTGGAYTFCPTNAEYVAAGIVDPATVTATGSGTAYTLNASVAASCGDWAQVRDNLVAGNNVTVTDDIAITTQNQGLYVTDAIARDVTLDLNGHTIDAYDGDGTTGEKDRLLTLASTVRSTITIVDSVGGGAFVGHKTVNGHPGAFAYVGYNCGIIVKGGAIRGFSTTDSGGAFYLSGTASLELDDGAIESCTAAGSGGAAYLKSGTTVTVNGGTVSNCVVTTGNGGAVYTAGTFTMNGGTIVGCSASTGGSGGAIFAANGGKAYIYGGSLCDNSSRYYGGAIYGQSTSTVAVYGGYFRGNRTQQANSGQFLCIDNWVQNGNVYGGVFDGYDPQTYGADDARAIKLQNAKTQIGDLYVIGNNPRVDETALTGGQYTFALTNAEYAATGLYDAEKATVTGSGTAWTVKTPEPVNPATWEELKAALVQGCDVTLTNDVTQTSAQPIFANNQQVTLDLNGHTLTQLSSNYWVFQLKSIGCKVTVKDSATGGKIVGDGNTLNAHGGCMSIYAGEFVLDSGTLANFKVSGVGAIAHVYASNGLFTMNGGTIENCTAGGNGGVFYVTSGRFYMYGGTISGCTSAANGGAVYADGTASTETVRIYGGTIENCTAAGCGGAIYNAADSTGYRIMIYGGTFRGNKATYGGALATSGGKHFDVYGGVFTGNTATKSCAFFDDASANKLCYLYGGEWANGYNPTAGNDDTTLIGGRACALVGSTYVVGLTGFTSTGGELVGGSFNFAVTNAEYAASGAKVFAGSTLSGSGTVFTLTPNEGAGVEAGDWATVKAALEAGLDVTLTNDIVQTAAQSDLTGSQNVTLDLNGFTIDRKDVSDNYWFMRVASANATLTITDSSEGKTGKVLGDASLSHGQMGNALRVEAGKLVINGGTFEGMFASKGGGCAYVASGATLVMNAGTITGCNSAVNGGAIYCAGSFTMNGGTIMKCGGANGVAVALIGGSCNMYGGQICSNDFSAVNTSHGSAVYLASGAAFNMHRGRIHHNKSYWRGPAVYVNGTSTANLYGGEIDNNTDASNHETILAYGSGSIVNVYGVYMHDNELAVPRKIVVAEAGGVATFHGGVFDTNPKTNASGLSIAGGSDVLAVGDNYVIGKGVVANETTLTEGIYTFCPTNAEYAAAGVKVAETPVAQGTTPETWAIALKRYCVCGDPECPGESAGEEHEIRTWYAWTSTTTLPTVAGNWYLAGDVNLSGQYSPATGVTIDLAGHTIRQTATNARVINLSANVAFTLTDSVGGGKVTGGNLTGSGLSGAAVYVDSGATLTMFGGSLCGNSSALTDGGAIYARAATVKLSGVLVEDNKACNYGGAMCIVGGGTHVFRNCVFRNNEATKYRGGAARLDAGTYSFIDCVVTNNAAAAHGGVSHHGSSVGTIFFGGATVVKDNHIVGQTAQNNVGVESGYTYSVSTDEPLVDGAQVGMTADAGAAIVTTPNDGDYTALFFADNDAYVVVNDANQVKLVSVYGVAATIGETRYSSLQYAFNSAEEGDTVVLATNVTENVVVESDRRVTLDLNGFVLKGAGGSNGSVITLKPTADLTIVDGDETKTHYFTVDSAVGTSPGNNNGAREIWLWNDANVAGAVDYDSLAARPAAGAVIAVKGGCVTGGTGTGGPDVYYHGGAVYQYVNSKLTVNGGSLVGNTGLMGGAIYQAEACEATLNGGRICGNRSRQHGGALYAAAGAGCVFTLNAGDVTFNYSSPDYGGTGGGICHGTTLVNGGRISWNKAANDAGGIRCSGSLTMTGGEIVGNEAASNGGGVSNGGAFTMNGGAISNCTATSYGGAVYVTGAFTLNDGVISGCETTKYDANVAYGGAVAVASGGTFTMNAGELINNRSGAESPNYGWGSAVNVASGGTSKIYGGVITNNTSFGNGPIRADGTSLVYGGVIKDNRWYWDTGTYKVGTVCGGVFDRSDVLTVQTDCMIEQVGDSWVVGANVAQEEGKLTGGTYTFNPANAEYAAADVAVAPWVDVTTDESGDPQTWTLTDGTSPVDAGTAAKARIKADGTCWITGSGETAETEALAAQWASVRDVRIASGVTGVGDYTFYKFSNLTNVTVSADCKKLGDGAFFRCLSLEQITFEGGIPEDRGENALVIHAGIRMEGDQPVVYAVPNVTVNGKDMTLMGSNDLENWASVTKGDEKNYHFFKFVAGE